MNTPTTETDAKFKSIYAKIVVHPYTIDLQEAEQFARELERERDEAVLLVAALTKMAHIQAGFMEAELARMPAFSQRDLGEHLAEMLKRFNSA